MNPKFIKPILDKPGPWIVTTLSGAYAMCSTGLNALRAAYRRTGEAQSIFDTPHMVQRVGTDERLTVEEILAEWRNQGWPLPSE
jgi:hypothetical protein